MHMMLDRKPRPRVVRRILAGALILAGFVAVSPGNVAARSTHSASAISGAQALLAKWSSPATTLTPSGPPFNAASAKGKTVGWVSISGQIPFTQQMMQGVYAGAKTLGLTIDFCDGQGTTSTQVACFNRFIAQKVNVIVDQSIDPRLLSAPIAAAAKAGILVVTTSTQFPGVHTHWPHTVGEDSQPFGLVAQLEGDFIIADSKGKSNTLIITSNEIYVAAGQVKDIQGEFSKYCATTCKSKVVDVPVADWQSKIAGVVQSAVQADPSINYVIPLYDGEAPFAISGIHAAAAQNRVKVVSFNATPGIMTFLKNKDVMAADVGVWIVQHGWAAVDVIARVLAGQRGTAPALSDSKLTTRVFTQGNVGSLKFSAPATWYGNLNLAAFYKKQWEVK